MQYISKKSIKKKQVLRIMTMKSIGLMLRLQDLLL